MNPTKSPPPNPADGYEKRDASVKAIVWSGVGLIVIVILVHLLLIKVFDVLSQREHQNDLPVSALSVYKVPPADPQLQGVPYHPTLPHEDLAKLLEKEQRVLSQYAWVEHDRGVARIPIQRAETLLLQRGVAWASLGVKPPATAPATAPAATAPMQSR